jgi:flagellar biosynthesis protein FliQ
MDQFFTWETLVTLAGASLAVGILTQFFKDTIKIPTQWLSYILAVIVLVLATGFTTVWMAPAAEWALIPFNAVIVSTSANGAYAAILRAKNGKPE